MRSMTKNTDELEHIFSRTEVILQHDHDADAVVVPVSYDNFVLSLRLLDESEKSASIRMGQ